MKTLLISTTSSYAALLSALPLSFLSTNSLLCLPSSRSSSRSPRFTSHSDQCLLQRTWVNSDEMLCAPLTNHTWKSIPLCLHIFLSFCFSHAIFFVIFYPFFFFFSCIFNLSVIFVENSCMKWGVTRKRNRWFTWSGQHHHNRTWLFSPLRDTECKSILAHHPLSGYKLSYLLFRREMLTVQPL